MSQIVEAEAKNGCREGFSGSRGLGWVPKELTFWGF